MFGSRYDFRQSCASQADTATSLSLAKFGVLQLICGKYDPGSLTSYIYLIVGRTVKG